MWGIAKSGAMKTVFNYRFASILIVQLMLVMIGPPHVLSQTVSSATGSLNFLDSARGYSDLVLGADTRQMPQKFFAFLDNDKSIDPDSCLKFKYNDVTMLDFEEGVKLDLVGLRAYGHQIVNIYLFFKSGDGFKMLRVLRKYFGNPTAHPNDFSYEWAGSEVTLQLRFENKGDLGIVIFSSNQLMQQVAVARTARDQSGANTLMADSPVPKADQNTTKSPGYTGMLANTRNTPKAP